MVQLVDGFSIGQPGMQRACVFCATNRALSSESRNFEIRNLSLSRDFSPEFNLDNPSRTCSPLQNTNTALTNFTGPRLFPVDPTKDPLLPHSSRSQPLSEKYQSAHQLNCNLPALTGGVEDCNRTIESCQPSASQWHLTRPLASASTTAANAIAMRTWHPVRSQQHSDITKEEGNKSTRLPCAPLQRPDSESLSGGFRRLHQKQLQPQQAAIHTNASISLQTFLTLWLKMCGCPSAVDLSTAAASNSVACVAERSSSSSSPPPPPPPTSSSFLSRLPHFFRASESSRLTESTAVASKPEVGYTSGLTLLPLRTVRVGSARCAFGSDIVTWLLENSEGALSSREEAKALCQAYTRASFLVPRPPSAVGVFEDNSTLFEIRELDDDSPRSGTIVAHRLSSPELERLKSPSISGSLSPVRALSTPFEPAWLAGINLLREPSTSQPSKRRFSPDIKSTYPGKDRPTKSTILEETPLTAEFTSTLHTNEIVKVSPQSQGPQSAPSITVAAQENELQTLLSEHIMELIHQDVFDYQLPSEWVSTIYHLAFMLSSQFRLDLRPVVSSNLQNRKNAQPGTNAHLPLIEDPALFEFFQNKYTAMNILRYVQVKKVIQSADEPCEILGGVAFTGQAIHKFLPKELHQPRVLLIASSISYERNLFRMTSLESHSMQEEEYLINCVGKVLAFRPTLLFVEGFISNTALEMFIKAERISRATGAPIVASIDTLLSGSFDCGPQTTSPVGHCQWYKVITVSQPNGTLKPLTLLGTEQPTLPNDAVFRDNSRVRWFRFRSPDVDALPEQTGRSFCLPAYTVILRGKDLATLKIVKRCLKFALLASYNGQLELAFMRDTGILPSSTASSLRYQNSVQLPRDLDDSPSSVAFHMAKRVFTFSAFTLTHLPFLAGSSGRSAPLWDFYSYLVEWPAGRRLNDVLKQKALVVRAQLYALRKRPSVHTLPSAKPGANTVGKLPAFCLLKLEPNLSPSLRLLRCRGGGAASGPLPHDSDDAICADSAPASDLTLACLSKRDAHAFSAARASAFHNGAGGSNHRVLEVFKRNWSGVGQWISQNRAGTLPPPELTFQIAKPNPKSHYKRLRRSVRDARSYASLSLARTVFSANSFLWPEPCIPTWIISIDFYGPNDLPLGLFLERFCFRSQTCLNRECDTPMQQHIQRFTQTSGSVELVLRYLDSVLPAADLTNDTDHTPIYMWTACSACSTSSQARLMSVASWHLSFIKFIDLLLNSTDVLTHISTNRPTLDDQNSGSAGLRYSSEQTNSNYQPHECSARSLQHFFALGKNLATFSYSTVSIYEVVMPPVEILIFSPQPEPALAAAYARHIGATVKSPFTSSTLGDPSPQHTKADAFRTLELPAYLRQEAYVVLKKFYQVTTLVKSHLFTLRHETMSDDLLALVKTLENHLTNTMRFGVFFRLADYNSTVKHLEKSARESRKRQQTTALPAVQSSSSIAFSLSTSSNLTKKHQRQVVDVEPPQVTPSSTTVQVEHTAPEGSRHELTTTEGPPHASALAAAHTDPTTSVLTGNSSSGGGTSTAVSGVLRLLTSIRPGSDDLKVCPDPWPASEHPQVAMPTLVSPIALLAAAGPNYCVKGASGEFPAASDGSYNRLLCVPPAPSTQPSLTGSSSADETTSRVLSFSSAITSPSQSELPQTEEYQRGLPFLHAYHDSQSISLLVSELLKVPLLSSTPDVYVNDQEFTSIIAYALMQPGGDTMEVGGKQAVSPFSSPRLRNIFRRKADTIPPEDTDVHDTDRHSQPLPASRVTDQSQPRTNKKIGVPTTETPSVRIGIQNDLVSFQTDSSVTDSSLWESHSDGPSVTVTTASNAKAPAPEKLPPALAQNPHIEIQYSDANTNFFVRVYYAAEFFNLRKLLFPQGENAFIWSLMRCQSWEARGGKSGSDFMKTRDERFVVKEVSAVEMRTFHEIHHQYFDHLMSAGLENCLSTSTFIQRLSVLARIVGLFHVGFKNSATGEARRLDVLVMENLFHNRPGITQIYDLKGSLRGRLITKLGSSLPQSLPVDIATSSNSCGTGPTSDNHTVATPSSSTGRTKKNTPSTLTNGDLVMALPPSKVPVLLDQNFINTSLENPIYLRLHSKNALMHCLNLDTLFLSDLFIMDYSLLVGIDPSTGHMVVGIIDYLRKFTLNKRLEMLVKQTITSAQGPMPTIITPEDYRERLLDQMDRNFQLVPDQWYDSLVDHTESWRILVNTPPKFVP
ncbi:unnamed protein product [Schistocephalus solidus]|uniref:1-phosphatidylinositol-3-phosphate 5-kinase n=1 Tax=Schistocephalus solidus TaxID=70667 RepID=A0A183SWN7_SCHSO|nr:unnamed protein product [Schistocephalus solidus]